MVAKLAEGSPLAGERIPLQPQVPGNREPSERNARIKRVAIGVLIGIESAIFVGGIIVSILAYDRQINILPVWGALIAGIGGGAGVVTCMACANDRMCDQ